MNRKINLKMDRKMNFSLHFNRDSGNNGNVSASKKIEISADLPCGSAIKAGVHASEYVGARSLRRRNRDSLFPWHHCKKEGY